MKIAVTITDFVQVGMNTYHDVSMTKVFDSSKSIDDILAWANDKDKHYNFHSLRFSVVEE